MVSYTNSFQETIGKIKGFAFHMEVKVTFFPVKISDPNFLLRLGKSFLIMKCIMLKDELKYVDGYQITCCVGGWLGWDLKVLHNLTCGIWISD